MFDTEAEVKKLEIQIEQLQAELATYESDYRIVVGLKDELLKIFIICENSEYTLECFKLSMMNIKRMIQDAKDSKVAVDAIEDYYNRGLLNIAAPEHVMDSFSRKMASITQDITVEEFENSQNALIHMVFDGQKMRFPSDDLNLNGMMVTYDKRE